MVKIKVLGIGSRIMKDDGIGIYLAEDLKEKLSDSIFEFIIGECDFDYCNSIISKREFIIVIDAYKSGKSPGEVTLIPLSDLKKLRLDRYSMHGIHFLQEDYFGVLIGIEPFDIDYGMGLSDQLQVKYNDIYKEVHKIITCQSY